MINWNAYRLPLLRMQSIADVSTHLRATCNFPDDGLVYTDYARAKFEGHDLFGDWIAQCRTYEFVNIRGIECEECTEETWQTKAWHIDSYASSSTGWQFDDRSDGYLQKTTLVGTGIQTLHFGAHPIKTPTLNTGLDPSCLINPLTPKNTKNQY